MVMVKVEVTSLGCGNATQLMWERAGGGGVIVVGRVMLVVLVIVDKSV